MLADRDPGRGTRGIAATAELAPTALPDSFGRGRPYVPGEGCPSLALLAAKPAAGCGVVDVAIGACPCVTAASLAIEAGRAVASARTPLVLKPPGAEEMLSPRSFLTVTEFRSWSMTNLLWMLLKITLLGGGAT